MLLTTVTLLIHGRIQREPAAWIRACQKRVAGPLPPATIICTARSPSRPAESRARRSRDEAIGAMARQAAA
jgi:hypothetical protein